MSKRQPNLLVEDIIESGNKILIYTEDLTLEEFVNNSKTVDAVVRNFEIHCAKTCTLVDIQSEY